MSPKLIVALDYNNYIDAKSLVDKLSSSVDYYKVGLELFLSSGVAIIEYLKKMNKSVFLDLKFHDIPNTVAMAIKSILCYNVDMINVHTQGGYEMMMTASDIIRNESSKQNNKQPLLIGVTLLTSLDIEHLRRFAIGLDPYDYVKLLASEAKSAGLDGVVSSVKEVKIIKEVCGNDFLTVTPGIRLATDSSDDQKRVVTPKSALDIGSDYIVVGRSITEADDPILATKKVLMFD